ncbi:MAG: VWA domain-containing protein, partial [Planctomycetota bacterium]
GYGSLDYSKVEYARTVAATLAYFLTRQHDAVGMLTFDETLGRFLPAKLGAKHFHQILVELSREVTGKATDIETPLRQVTSLVPRRGLIVLVSDLLISPETLKTELAAMRARGHEVVLLRVLDPAEIELQINQPAMVVDAESGRQVYIDPASARATYQERFRKHREDIESICQSTGVALHELTSDQPLDRCLSNLIETQNQIGRGASRFASEVRS